MDAIWSERRAAADAAFQKALQNERQAWLDAAYSLYTQAAKGYLWLLQNAQEPYIKQEIKQAAARALARADKIKAARPDVRAQPPDRLDSLEQDSVLQASSAIHGQRYSPWTSELPREIVDGILYSDPYGHFPLSDQQQLALHSFKRIAEISPDARVLSKDTTAEGIVQNSVTDCSVISALIACLNHHNKFGSKLGISCLYPQDGDGWPRISPSGRYLAKLMCNGVERSVSIDDYLPVDAAGTPLCANMAPRNEFWAALMEKAYVRIHGGYRILGSIPSIDIYSFTSWIPEFIEVSHPGFQAESTWSRLRQAFEAGSCLITVGTGNKPITTPDGHVFDAHHAYAVLGMHELASGTRLMEMIDPWPTLRRNDSNDDDAGRFPERTCQVHWDFFRANFPSLYCNWDPKIFAYSQSTHVRCNSDANVNLIIQMGLSESIEADEVWFLVSKHIEKEVGSEFFGLSIEDGRLGHKRSLGTGLPHFSELSNSPHTLVKHTTHRPQSRLNVHLTRKGPAREVRFTIAVYSQCPFRLEDGLSTLPCRIQLEGEWRGKSRGGNPLLSTWIYNPQWHFTVASHGSPLSCLITLSSESDVAVNVILVRLDDRSASRHRLQNFEDSMVVADASQGGYSPGQAVLRASDLNAGNYIIVVSTYNPQEATYRIRIDSSATIHATLLPQDDAGRFTRSIESEWSLATAGGNPSESTYFRNPQWHLSVSKSATYRFRLVPARGGIECNVAIFKLSSSAAGYTTGQSVQQSPPTEVASSGPYSAYVSGVVTEEVQLKAHPHGYLVVPSTYSPGVLSAFSLVVIATQRIDIDQVL